MLILKTTHLDNLPMEAHFDPEHGVNLTHFSIGNCALIDPATRPLFEARSAGLGALIGPHFHHREAGTFPVPYDRSLFPHFSKVTPWGETEPFSHGIARYVPWEVVETGLDYFVARLNSQTFYKGTPIGLLEGKDFVMELQAHLFPHGLFLDYRVASQTPSVIGFHYYYRLPAGKAFVKSPVEPHYRTEGVLKPFKPNWQTTEGKTLIPIEGTMDFGFLPTDPHSLQVGFYNGEYKLEILSKTIGREQSFQLYHPDGESFVCIEPLSARDPRHPTQTGGILQVTLLPRLGNFLHS